MPTNITIDYPPNSTLYALIRNEAGQVWHNKKNKYVDWNDKELNFYCINLKDKGGDRYVCDRPKLLKTKPLNIQIFKQRKNAPGEYDQLIGSNTELKVADYPIKRWAIKPGEVDLSRT